MIGAPLNRAFAIFLTTIFLLSQIGLSTHDDFSDEGQHSDCAVCLFVPDDFDGDDPEASRTDKSISAGYFFTERAEKTLIERSVLTVGFKGTLARAPPA